MNYKFYYNNFDVFIFVFKNIKKERKFNLFMKIK